MINQNLLDFALESIKKGVSVIPVGKNKIPLIGWKVYQERIATESEVKQWFSLFDDPQIGIVTGKVSNLTVVDIEKGGDPSFLPQDTKIVSTGGNGYHYYFLYEEGVTNKARIKELVDIRSEGGYVVAPGSSSEKGPYVTIQEKPLLPFPKNLFPEKVDIFNYPGSTNPGFQKKEIKDYPGYGPGQRNDEMARYIGYILTQIHPADWDNEGWNIIERANQSNTPPLAPRELIATFNSIKRTERSKNPLGHISGLSSGYSEPLYLDTGEDEVMSIAEVADAQELNSSEAFPLDMPVFDNAIGGGVNLGDVIAIAGQSGHGKTTLAQDWTMSLSNGNKNLKALWFSYEVLPVHLWNKFQEMGMKREDCAFIPLKHTTGNVSWIEKKIQEGKEKFGIKTVFIDHLGFLLPKTNGVLGKNMSSNYSTFLTQIMRDLKTIAIKEEVIIFLPVHMSRKNDRNRRADVDDIADTSGVAKESDLVFLIEREKNKDVTIKSYFTDRTIITLGKNRKTGITVVGNFTMLNGRFAYDDSQDKADEDFASFDEIEEVKEENIIEEVVIKSEPQQLPYYNNEDMEGADPSTF